MSNCPEISKHLVIHFNVNHRGGKVLGNVGGGEEKEVLSVSPRASLHTSNYFQMKKILDKKQQFEETAFCPRIICTPSSLPGVTNWRWVNIAPENI